MSNKIHIQMKTAMIRKHVIYSGNVQGVGFRYTAVRIATNYNVTGYVKNLPDNRVEMIVEGTAAQIEAFISQLAEAMAGYIRDTKINSQPHIGLYKNFSVSF